jgi:serine/threonine protein kinase
MMINCGGCRQKFIKLRACAWQVADFGLAKLTVSGTGTDGIVGTFGYMPPTITEVHQH